MISTTVLVTSYNDRRITTTLDSIRKQSRQPEEILVADGGTSWDVKEVCTRYGARFELLPGNVVETRDKAIKFVTNDIIVFIDTDEIAPPTWLENLTRPIMEGRADFVGGTVMHADPRSGPERYLNELEDDLYSRLVKENISFLPMGNSAWKREVLDRLGGFDLSISGGGEDYDINLRALKVGFVGMLVEDAAVFHDHSDMNSYWKLARKRYSYLRATARTYIKNNTLSSRVKNASATKVKHPFRVVETVMKPLVLLDALIRR